MTAGQSLAQCLQRLGLFLLILGMPPLSSFAQIGPPPVITVQPLDITVTTGDTASFTTRVASVTKVTYEWRLNGTRISGANKSIYNRSKVTAADAGDYSVLVQNASGSVLSSNAVLVVVPQPIPQPLRFVLTQMTTNGFSMVLSGPAQTNYVILSSTDLQQWTPISTNAAPLGFVSFTDTNIASGNWRWYRAKLQ
jgi:Ig-like domain-containing protein